MSKFRNKVVHGYIDVDAKTIYETMQKRLGDFDLFFADVKRMIHQEQARAKRIGKMRPVLTKNGSHFFKSPLRSVRGTFLARKYNGNHARVNLSVAHFARR